MALSAGASAVFVTAVSPYVLALGILGLVLLAVGLFRASPKTFAVGTGLLFVGVVVAGILGMASVYLLLAAFLVVIAWTVGQNGFSIGAEVGTDAPTLRIELVHLVSSMAILVVGASVGFGVFLTATGGQPVLALVALLVGVVALLVGLRGSYTNG
ncbi:DUF7519 family protein [Halogeometricum borinquense]